MVITTKELAGKAELTQSRVRQLCIAGEIKAEKPGRDWLIPEEEAKRFLRERGLACEKQKA